MSYEDGKPWPELVCVLCGLIVIFDRHGSANSYPGRCQANAGGDHISPSSPGSERAKEIHAAWLRSPMDAPAR